jgi:hypothetical protein
MGQQQIYDLLLLFLSQVSMIQINVTRIRKLVSSMRFHNFLLLSLMLALVSAAHRAALLKSFRGGSKSKDKKRQEVPPVLAGRERAKRTKNGGCLFLPVGFSLSFARGSPRQVLLREKDLIFGGGMLWFSKACKVMERLVKSGLFDGR